MTNCHENLLANLGDKCRRQIELTINAFCRSTRKALRQAENHDKNNAPAAQRQAAWQEVDRRCETLCRLLGQLTPQVAEPAPEPAAQDELDLADLERETQRIAALPRKNIGQVRHARREEAKLLARLSAAKPLGAAS